MATRTITIDNATGRPVSSVTTDTEIGYVAGVTSSIQTQLNSKQGTPNSSVILDSAASTTGSSGTSVRYFTNSATVGTDITYTHSTVNGDSFTIQTDGIYNVTYSDVNGSDVHIGVGLNASTTVDVNALAAANRLALSYVIAGQIVTVSTTHKLTVGAVITAQIATHTTGWATDNRVQFAITRVS